MTATTDPLLFSHEPHCLKIRAVGRAILDGKDEVAQAIAAVIAAQPVRAAILDLREVPGNFSFTDRIQMGEAAGRYLAGTPFAVILREAQVDPDRIGKVVACNRGANVEIFTDEAEARAWVEKYVNR